MAKLKSIGKRISTLNQDRTGSAGTDRITGNSLYAIRKRIFKRDGYLCQICLKDGRTTIAEEVDHIMPLYAGGAESDENRQSVCKACHLEKSAAEEAQRRI